MNFETHSITETPQTRPPLSRLTKIALWTLALLLIIGGFTMYRVALALKDRFSHVSSPVDLVLSLGKELAQDQEGRTNIVLLGGGGKAYDEGSDLTDSVMVASLNHQTHQVFLISIPRDLFVHVPPYGYYRVNALWPLAKSKLGGDHAETLVQDALEDITGLTMHYYVKVDFRGFEKFIDELGGLDISIEQSFTDSEYPTNNYEYQTVSFEAGPMHVDGAQALQFARSRHGNNGEGGDFQRAKRQQLILKAVQSQLLSLNLLSDNDKLGRLISTINEHYATNLNNEEILSLGAFGRGMGKDQVHSYVLQEGPGELLYVPSMEVRSRLYGGAYALQPLGDSFDIVHQYIRNFLQRPEANTTGPTIEILNGTKTEGLATKVAAVLLQAQLNVYDEYGVRNTLNHTRYQETQIYDWRKGANADTLRVIQHAIGGNIVPSITEPHLYSGVDITVIVGEDYLKR